MPQPPVRGPLSVGDLDHDLGPYPGGAPPVQRFGGRVERAGVGGEGGEAGGDAVELGGGEPGSHAAGVAERGVGGPVVEADEQRAEPRVVEQVVHRFGERWQGRVGLRGQQVGIFSIDEDAPVDFFDAEDYADVFAKVTREVDQARAMGDALRDSEKSFSLLVQSVTDYAILLLDPDGRVTSWNEGAERIKGYKAGEIIGHSFRRFYPPEAVAAGLPERELETAARDGRFEDEDWRVRKDGSRFWANVVVTALRNDAGELLGYAKVTRDLTARREAENQARKLAVEEAQHAEATRRSEELASLNERLRRSNDELRSALEAAEDSRHAAEEAASAMAEAYRQLDQFAYIASHDLKAPLRGIANLAQWIQDDAADELSSESAEHLRLLQGRVQRMEALIDGILAYSRAGRVTAVPEKVDTGALVREVIDLVAPPEGVTIVVPDDLPTLETELLPLQQVFMNLIVNAVKYSGATRADATVHIGWRDTGEAIEFFVRDNGPGILPEVRERIFVPFFTTKASGSGIGLSLSRQILRLHGGTLTVRSTPGVETVFVLRF